MSSSGLQIANYEMLDLLTGMVNIKTTILLKWMEEVKSWLRKLQGKKV